MTNEDEEDESKYLWSKMRKLPNNMKKIMLARNKNEKKTKVKKKKANSPMESSMNNIYDTSDRICNSASMYRKEQQDEFFHEDNTSSLE